MAWLSTNTLAQRLAYLTVAALLLYWFFIAAVGDSWWWTLPLLYGPRWFASILLVGLLPGLWFSRRHMLWPTVLSMAVLIFGINDFNLPFRKLWASQSPLPIRMLQMNTGAGSGGVKIPAVLSEVGRVQPDVITIAECSVELIETLAATGGWFTKRSVTRLCLASRWPIADWQERDPKDFWRMNGSGAIARAIVETPAGKVRLGVVHLETPREALQEFIDLSSIPTLGELTRKNIELRHLESQAARQWIFETDALPTLIGGDFNLPEDSAVYRRYWHDLKNSFSHAGWGTGHSKFTSLWGSRIDHILTTHEFDVNSATIGHSIGSDHRPLIVELSLND